MKRARECVCQQLDFHGKEDTNESGLPGFRFHPTEQELVEFYLKKAVQGKRMKFNVIRMLDLYRYDPWELPSFSPPGEAELFFFVPRGKNGSGRTNRIAVSGYWKSTGSDRPILDGRLRCIGLRKTLVFYEGRAPHGQRTDWVMKEYRMPDHHKPQVEVVVCRIHRKASPLKGLEQQTLNRVEVRPSAYNDDELDCSNKPPETRFSSPSRWDKKLNNKDGARGERCTILSSASPECHEAQQIPATRELQIAPNLCQCAYAAEAASSSVEDNYVARTDVWSSSAENNWDVYERLIDPAFEAIVDYDKCEGFSVSSNDRHLRFMDLLGASSDRWCFDLEFPDAFIDGESAGVKKQLQAAPDLSVRDLCTPQSFVSTPKTFNLWDPTASTPEHLFLDEEERFQEEDWKVVLRRLNSPFGRCNSIVKE